MRAAADFYLSLSSAYQYTLLLQQQQQHSLMMRFLAAARPPLSVTHVKRAATKAGRYKYVRRRRQSREKEGRFFAKTAKKQKYGEDLE